MQKAVTYQLSAPSMDGCTSCGQAAMNCKCIKFDREAPRDGLKITDELMHDPIKHFFHYAAPVTAVNTDSPPLGEIAHSQNNAVSLGMPSNASQSAAMGDGPSF